jgi:hypothetical protein
MTTSRKPIEGQMTLPFMAEKKRTAKPKLAIVRAEGDDQPAEDKPKPATKTKRRLKAG